MHPATMGSGLSVASEIIEGPMSRRREICGLEVVEVAGVPGPRCLEVEPCLRERATGFQGQTVSAISVILLFHFRVIILDPEGVAGRIFKMQET
jgi:hypothetical protein